MIEWYKTINPQTIIFARQTDLKIDALTTDEAKTLLNYFRKVPCISYNEKLIKTRNLLICSLLLYTGLRVNELSGLTIDEVGEDFQVIWKWWKRRYVHIPTETKAILDLYVRMREDSSRWLFISHAHNANGRLTNASIERIIREWWEKAGIQWKVFPHKLRHTFATELVKNQVELIKVQKLLGHESIKTTENYITVYNKELKDAVAVINFD
jgi:integrase/recombinase XerD